MHREAQPSDSEEETAPQNDELPRTVAIDGPAGAGKSTIGRLLAERLGYLFLDTGAMYRAVALEALEQGISTDDEQHLADMASRLPIRIERPLEAADGRAYTVFVRERDVTGEIRKPEVEAIVSAVARWPTVRVAMVRQQRRMATLGPVVMVGRDITTDVLPDADLKIYLDASIDERARRRFDEVRAARPDITLDRVKDEIERRDEQDMHRAAGALRVASDAVTVKTDGYTIAQSLDKITEVARSARRA